MYTLKIESVNDDFLRAVQAVIQENKLWRYREVTVGLYSTSVEVSTMSIKELNYLINVLRELEHNE
jgi:hypothetical protein